jgi:ABC-type polysaccharide/polyol phosphate export permease
MPKKYPISKNRNQLIWALAKTDFKMRYHGSFLGYVWGLLKPLLIFSILNFVFSFIINRGAGIENYSLQLITGLVFWNFFSEGTMSGLISLHSKAGIISKIYFPRWIVIISSTLNNLLVFLLSLIILVIFFLYYNVIPAPTVILITFFYTCLIYTLVVSFSFIAAPLYLKYRDISQIWEVALQFLFFAAPIVYPLQLLPEKYHKIILLNPIGILIHYIKMVLIENRYPSFKNNVILILMLAGLFTVSWLYFKKASKKIVENL